MILDGNKWRRSNKIVDMPLVSGEVHIRFGRICKQDDRGAVRTDYIGPEGSPVFAKPITPNGWSLTNMMYGKRSVRGGEVRVHAYLYRNGVCYTTSWVHDKETIEYQQKRCKSGLTTTN